MEKFFQALAALLPTGFAWPRDAGSTLMRVMRGIAGTFSEHHDFTTEAVRQWQPATTVNRLAEWEAATGLPDPCFPAPLELLGPGRYAVDPVRVANFSRLTPATYIDDAGVRQTAPANVARYEGGLLMVEPEATNLLLRSNNFSNAVWLKTNCTVAISAIASPIAGSSAWKLILSAGLTAATSYLGQNIGFAGLHAITIFAKAAELRYLRLNTGSYDFNRFAIFDLQTGVITSPSGNADTFETIEPAGDGWWRIGIFSTAVTSSFSILMTPQDAPIGNGSASDGAGGLYICGAQIERGLVATSYFETISLSITRAADVVYLFPLEAATRDLRRKLLLSRLRGPVLAYDNSSPASPDAIVAICAGLGYVATVAYNLPFRCGVNRVGDRLGALDGKLYVTVTLQSKAFRVGVSRVGQRLLEGQLNGGELACYLQRVIPARYQLNMIFI